MLSPPDLRVVIFDLDGTLVPTMHGFADVAGHVIEERRGVPFQLAHDRYLETSGVPFFQQLEVMFPGHGDNAAAADEFERRKVEIFCRCRMAPPVREALLTLKRNGLQLAVSSNNFESLVADAIEREASGCFDAVLGYRTGFAKGPAHFAALFDRFSVEPGSCLFCGDSLSDQERARAAQVDFVAVVGTFPRARFLERDPDLATVDSVSELPALLGLDRVPRAGAHPGATR